MWMKTLAAMGMMGCLMVNGCAALQTASAAAAPADVAGVGQQVFDTDDAAAQAVVAAAKARDQAQIEAIFGPATKELLSGDKVEDDKAFNSFVTHAGEKTVLEKKDANTSVLDIGADGWPFPIPLVRRGDGKWFFDTEAGKAEILARRIGANELETIKVCHAYVEAQREYASEDRDGSGVLKYAQHFLSHPGRKDGLYWDAAPGQETSPFGPLVAQATLEGYNVGHGDAPHSYRGYYYHILTRQGASAPGGDYNYVINGNMIAGFAMVACPDVYGQSGIMTFMVSHSGKVFQKDLGPDSLNIVRRMHQYNPDTTWTEVK
jgi:hypothetical protein